MSSKNLIVVVAAVAALVAGCGKKEASAPEQSGASSTAVTPTTPTSPPGTGASAAVPPAAGEVRAIEITANDAMKFSVTRIDAKAGETIKIVLRNVGNLPKAAMGHNFVLLKKGVNIDEFAASAINVGPAKDYFPADRSGDTLGHTKLIGPRETADATITLPNEPGELQFLCTFPGHYAAGMRGVIVVQ